MGRPTLDIRLVFRTLVLVGASPDAPVSETATEKDAVGTPPRTGRRKSLKVLGFGVGGAVIAGFQFLVYGYVFSNGLCCADDSYIAAAAKNLALGDGYAASASPGGHGLRLFDPFLSTGPTLVLPAAAIIRVFGATPWAPGLATALATTALLALIGLTLGRRVGWLPTVWYVAVMLTLMYTLTAGSRFVQWYSLIGEVPAVMFTILGVALFVWRPGKRRLVAWSFLAFGLAFMTKNLALLGVMPVAIWLLVSLVRSGGRHARQWTDLAVAAVCFSVPFLLFEAWKVTSLGITGYLSNWEAFKKFLSSTGGTAVGGRAGSSLWGHVVKNSETLHASYGFGMFELLLVVVAVGALVHFYTDHKTRTFCWLLIAAGAAHITWYVISSTGHPRYALIGLLLLAASVACVALARPPAVAIAVAVAVVAIAAIPAHSVLEVPVTAAVHGSLFRPNQRVTNLEATALFLTKVKHKDPLVGSWWATIGDLEYMLPTASNFVTTQDVGPALMHDGRLLVRNRVWVSMATSTDFTRWARTCQKVLFDAPPYLVTQCPHSRASDQPAITK